jgi:hypothetical protein
MSEILSKYYFAHMSPMYIGQMCSADRMLLICGLYYTLSMLTSVCRWITVYLMKGFSGQNYIYDMTHQIYDMKYEMICCISVRTLCKSM